MSATPERSDSRDIYSIYDNNIALDVRLNDALEKELVSKKIQIILIREVNKKNITKIDYFVLTQSQIQRNLLQSLLNKTVFNQAIKPEKKIIVKKENSIFIYKNPYK